MDSTWMEIHIHLDDVTANSNLFRINSFENIDNVLSDKEYYMDQYCVMTLYTQHIDCGGYDLLKTLCDLGVNFIARHGRGYEYQSHLIVAHRFQMYEHMIGTEDNEFVVKMFWRDHKLGVSRAQLRNLVDIFETIDEIKLDWRERSCM